MKKWLPLRQQTFFQIRWPWPLPFLRMVIGRRERSQHYAYVSSTHKVVTCSIWIRNAIDLWYFETQPNSVVSGGWRGAEYRFNSVHLLHNGSVGVLCLPKQSRSITNHSRFWPVHQDIVLCQQRSACFHTTVTCVWFAKYLNWVYIYTFAVGDTSVDSVQGIGPTVFMIAF